MNSDRSGALSGVALTLDRHRLGCGVLIDLWQRRTRQRKSGKGRVVVVPELREEVNYHLLARLLIIIAERDGFRRDPGGRNATDEGDPSQ